MSFTEGEPHYIHKEGITEKEITLIAPEYLTEKDNLYNQPPFNELLKTVEETNNIPETSLKYLLSHAYKSRYIKQYREDEKTNDIPLINSLTNYHWK